MDSPRRLLVIQLRRLGDVLLTTPAVDALRRAYPGARIDFLVEKPGDQLLAGNPAIDEVVVYDASRPLAMIREVRSRRYDWVIDFLGTPRSAIVTAFSGAARRIGPGHVFHRWAYDLKFPAPRRLTWVPSVKLGYLEGALGLKPPATVRATFPVPEEARVRAGFAMAALGVGPGNLVLAVLPFSRRPVREWPHEHVAAMLRAFHRRNPKARSVIFWGTSEERERALKLQEQAGPGVLLGPEARDLKMFGGLLLRCDAAFTCDNGPKHMAQALGVPTFTVFGAVRPQDWNPPGDARFVSLRRDELFCIGCSSNVCPYALECVRGLEPARVLERLEEFLNGLRETTERPVEA